MKIAFLSFYSGHIDRGVEVAVFELAKRLGRSHRVTLFQAGKRQEDDVSTLILDVEKKWPQDTSGSIFRLIYFDYYSRKIAWFTLKFLPYLFNEKYDVVIPTNGGWQVLFCRLATWFLGKKLLVQGNAGIGRDDFWQLLMHPDVYIAISPAGYKWVQSKLSWIKKTYIPYGVDCQMLKSIKTADIKLTSPIILCVCAFSPFKRVRLLIDAVAKLKNVSLLLIGQGPDEETLRTTAKKLIGTKRFLMLTGITHEELWPYYKAADIFSLPSSKTEAFGIVQIEAMAMGLAVVATDDFNRQEIIGEAGILVDPTNTDAYAQALRLALNVDFGQKPQIQAQKFSWDKIIRDYNQLLNQIKI